MFEDRREAGRKLAATLSEYAGKNTLVLALPRGGVEVAFEVAKALGAPLDTIVARKIGMPGAPEYAVGAIAPGEVRVVEHEVPGIDAVIARESEEIRRRMRVYKSGSYSGKEKPDTILLVDDGVATGQTALAALVSLRAAHPSAQLVFAVPVGAPDALQRIAQHADGVVALEAPQEFRAVGEWYRSFPQLNDKEVIGYLVRARRVIL